MKENVCLKIVKIQQNLKHLRWHSSPLQNGPNQPSFACAWASPHTLIHFHYGPDAIPHSTVLGIPGSGPFSGL